MCDFDKSKSKTQKMWLSMFSVYMVGYSILNNIAHDFSPKKCNFSITKCENNLLCQTDFWYVPLLDIF